MAWAQAARWSRPTGHPSASQVEPPAESSKPVVPVSTEQKTVEDGAKKSEKSANASKE